MWKDNQLLGVGVAFLRIHAASQHDVTFPRDCHQLALGLNRLILGRLQLHAVDTRIDGHNVVVPQQLAPWRDALFQRLRVTDTDLRSRLPPVRVNHSNLRPWQIREYVRFECDGGAERVVAEDHHHQYRIAGGEVRYREGSHAGSFNGKVNFVACLEGRLELLASLVRQWRLRERRAVQEDVQPNLVPVRVANPQDLLELEAAHKRCNIPAQACPQMRRSVMAESSHGSGGRGEQCDASRRGKETHDKRNHHLRAVHEATMWHGWPSR
mmetsp:Transcript_38140/g.105058  ORF Transcript_38140/g.105058 Transcript_38140/m.105058 type:complete len:268 (+) Transcript_38140:213-1016(+)